MLCADCKHELLPIQTGIRLALVYNLVLSAPEHYSQTCNSHLVSEVAVVADAWNSEACYAVNDCTIGNDNQNWHPMTFMLEHK